MYSFAPSTRSQVRSGKRSFESVRLGCGTVEREGPSSGHERVRVGRGKEVKAGPRVKSLASWALRGRLICRGCTRCRLLDPFWGCGG